LSVIIASPGTGVETYCKQLEEKFSGFVHARHISDVLNTTDVRGIILENYPSNKSQIEEFNEKVCLITFTGMCVYCFNTKFLSVLDIII